jgi:hypothetical protein
MLGNRKQIFTKYMIYRNPKRNISGSTRNDIELSCKNETASCVILNILNISAEAGITE